MAKNKWTLEMLQKEALKYKTRGMFQKGNCSAYHAAYRIKALDEICAHMTSGRILWTDEELHEEALKYKTRKSFFKGSPAYGVAARRGILDKVCSHMKYARRQWTYEELANEALKYKTKGEFQKESPVAYKLAFDRNILDNICSHTKLVHEKWTKKKLAQEALKYKTRTEFQKKYCGAYVAALRKGILDEICKHMSVATNISVPEQSLFDIVKSMYPKAQKLTDRKVKIKNKPHICGFDLDIYIPELRKGIEFDGIYWHSEKGLRRSRDHWPKEDLRNYHQLKDSWFESKRIEVLHIKEEDWNKNKQICINKCMDFLKKEKGK